MDIWIFKKVNPVWAAETLILITFLIWLNIRGVRVEIVEVEVTRSSPILNRKIRDLSLPAGSIFIAVIRGEEVIIPYGETEFRVEDEVLALVKRSSEQALREIL